MASDPLSVAISDPFQRRLRRGFWIVCTALVGIAAGVMGYEHWERFETAVEHLGEKASLIARVLDDSVDHALHHTDDALRAAAVHPPPGNARAVLAGRIKTSPHMLALARYDAAGKLVAAAGDIPSDADVSARAFFRAHRERSDRGLRIEATDSTARLMITRRAADRTGAFAGVAVAVFTLDPVFTFRRDTERRENMTFALLSPDGSLLAHDPPARNREARWDALAQGPEKTGRGPWPFDGQDRVYAHRTLGNAPVTVAVGLSTAGTLAALWEEVTFEGAIFAAFAAFLFGGGLFLLRAIRRLGETQILHGTLDRRLNLIADTIPVRVSITRATDRRMLWANQRWMDYYGLTEATVGSFSIRDAYVDTAEHDRLVALLRERGSVDDFLVQIRNQAGIPRWLTLSARRVRYENEDAIIVASVDITNLRRAEKAEQRALREMTGVVNAVADGLIGIDAKGIIRLFNPAAENIFGYAAADVMGRNVSILMPSPFAQEHDGYLDNYLRTGVARVIGRGREVIGRRKDGTTFPMSLAINDVRADAPDVDTEESPRVRFIGAVRDITERKRIETALLTAKSQAEIANRAKSDFLAHVTHELRTPLNAILGFADMIRSRALGNDAIDRYAEYGDHIHTGGRTLLKTIEGLLDMATTDAGRYVLAEEKLTLAAILTPVLDSLRPMAEGVGIRLTAEFPPTLPALRVDPHAVHQVFGNILSNALKFTPKGGTVVLSATIEESGALAIAVADSGCGIPQDRLAHIFEPFVHADAYVARPNEGMGIGLPVARSFMELHGGTLDVQSIEGRGTTVVVRFPAWRTAGL